VSEESFYMVYNPQGGPPRVCHAHDYQANSEAERLARENPGQRFYVLRALRYVERNDVRRVELHEPTPF
jgi:hypothetical protein